MTRSWPASSRSPRDDLVVLVADDADAAQLDPERVQLMREEARVGVRDEAEQELLPGDEQGRGRPAGRHGCSWAGGGGILPRHDVRGLRVGRDEPTGPWAVEREDVAVDGELDVAGDAALDREAVVVLQRAAAQVAAGLDCFWAITLPVERRVILTQVAS